MDQTRCLKPPEFQPQRIQEPLYLRHRKTVLQWMKQQILAAMKVEEIPPQR
jgi:hypothetical protein